MLCKDAQCEELPCQILSGVESDSSPERREKDLDAMVLALG